MAAAAVYTISPKIAPGAQLFLAVTTLLLLQLVLDALVVKSHDFVLAMSIAQVAGCLSLYGLVKWSHDSYTLAYLGSIGITCFSAFFLLRIRAQDPIYLSIHVFIGLLLSLIVLFI